jgi:hypothetical protein
MDRLLPRAAGELQSLLQGMLQGMSQGMLQSGFA